MSLVLSRINSVLVALLHTIIADKDRTDNVEMADKRRIDIKVTEKEFEILDRYCNEMGLRKTVVLRELIRKLGEENAEDSRAIAWLAAVAAADSTPSLKGGACVSLFGTIEQCYF